MDRQGFYNDFMGLASADGILWMLLQLRKSHGGGGASMEDLDMYEQNTGPDFAMNDSLKQTQKLQPRIRSPE